MICISAERFKTWGAGGGGAHFPIHRDVRTGMQWATLGKSGSEAASQLQGRIARAFSYFDSSTIVRLSGLL